MSRSVRRVAATLGVAALTLVPAVPAHATVHEIVAQWCSGHDPLEPPGLSGGSSADNFARPLVASGFVGGTVPFDPPGPQAEGLLVTFNYDLPHVKVQGTGTYVAVGSSPVGPVYIELIEPNPDFPAFRSCPGLAGQVI